MRLIRQQAMICREIFYAASLSEVDAAMNLADKAFGAYRQIDRNKKGRLFTEHSG